MSAGKLFQMAVAECLKARDDTSLLIIVEWSMQLNAAD